ncbi:VOC family protein [Streptomyces sp. 549]|uniref:VOC family protein n=1 Tax=Streptomyces sp. 549 TaxID=3049076 RepID=UPI0024C2FA9B|nr:VOC family protein [Streptomyces sp. 549]MDK1474759.1 VOC family protein [Streptomyces sp. 549]
MSNHSSREEIPMTQPDTPGRSEAAALPEVPGGSDVDARPDVPDVDALRARRAQIRARHLKDAGDRPPPPTRGVHHVAFICRDVAETVDFYQGLLGFPLVEMVENRDYPGSTHFFFDLGNNNLLGFFDFPGHPHPPFTETVGGVQHLALSMDPVQHAEARRALDTAGIAYVGPDRGVEESLYLKDPNGVPVELYRERLGVFDGNQLT